MSLVSDGLVACYYKLGADSVRQCYTAVNQLTAEASQVLYLAAPWCYSAMRCVMHK